MQLGVMSILTLITVAAFTHVATMILFRRLVIGSEKPSAIPQPTINNDEEEEFHVPVRFSLGEVIDPDNEPSMVSRLASKLVNLSRRLGDLRPGMTREIYVKHYKHRPDGQHVLLLCNPSGQTVESLASKAIALSEAIGFDSLVMFDYRPTGRSCKGIVAPDATTMLEDAESVIQWLITVNGINAENISIAGISLGGLQALRLALRHRQCPRLVLINTFSSFSCLLRSSVSLLPEALRIGGTSSFLPDITKDLHSLITPIVAVISVEGDERVPSECTEEMLGALQGPRRLMHLVMKGTHSSPQVDYNSLDTVREFLGF